MLKRWMFLLMPCGMMGAGVVAASPLAEFEPGRDLAASAAIVPDAGGRRGWSGFSFVTEFACTNAYDGPVVSKPGVFSFEISGKPDNRVYRFRMFGTRQYDPKCTETEVSADAESEPSAVIRVAGVCTCYSEPEQSSVGYRLALYVNGELIGANSCERFQPNRKTAEPVRFAEGVDVRSVALGDHAFALDELFPHLPKPGGRYGAGPLGAWMTEVFFRALWNLPGHREVNDLDACFKTAKAVDPDGWNGRQKGVRFLATPELVVAVATGRVTGNPVLGVWNRTAGQALLAGDGLAWGFQYVGGDGVTRRMRSDSRRIKSTTEFRDGGFVVTSRGNGFSVRHDVRVGGGRIERALDIEDLDGHRIVGTEFPSAVFAKLPGEDTLVEPRFSGICFSNPTAGHRLDGWMFPGGMVTMQMAGYYDDRQNGIYFGAEDPTCATKTYTADGANGRLLLRFSGKAPRDDGQMGAKRFSPSARGVIELYRGGWYELGQVYRKFLSTSAPWYDKTIPRTDTPEWFMRNPLWIVSLAQKRSRLPAVRYLNKYFEVPTSWIVSIVEAPGGVGGFGPEYRLRPEVQDCIKELRKGDIRFLTYTNPRLWYCGPGAEEYNDYSHKGKLWSTKNEKGEPYISPFGKENYVVPCLGVDKWLDYLRNRTHWLSESGISGIYHDQLPCSIPFLCYDPTHGHKVGDPSVWLTGGLWRFCDYLMGDLRKEHPEIVHTGEDASEPFVNKIDGFLPWRFGKPGHVPLFQSLYSPRIQFFARGCDGHRIPGSYESFFPKYAEQLCFGEQIGWTEYNAVTYPSPRRGYLKKLAHCRYVLADFLNSSEMQAPLSFALAPEKFTSVWGVDDRNSCNVDKVLSSVWRHIDGRQLVMFLNVTGEPQAVEPVWNRAGNTFAVCREGSDAPEVCAAAPKRVSLDPYGFEFWVIDDRGEVAKPLAKTLARAARFWRDDRGEMLAMDPAAFRKTVELDATGGKEIAPVAAAWGLLVTIPTHPHCDYFRHDSKLKDGWAAAMDGGLVSYGTVDFGTGAKAMEMVLATDQPGVKVEFIDVTGDMPERVIAAFRPEAGDWHGYRPYVSPLFGDVHGKRAVICRVTGGICNLRNWKLLTTGEAAPERPLADDAPGATDFTASCRTNGWRGVSAVQTAWTLFARRQGDCLVMRDGAYAYYDVVNFEKNPTKITVAVESADPGTVLEFVDVSELAPSTPLARMKAERGVVKGDLAFKVEMCRNIVLRVKGGSCTLSAWYVR